MANETVNTIENEMKVAELEKRVAELEAFNAELIKEKQKLKDENLTLSVEKYQYETAFKVLVKELKKGDK